PAGPPVAGDDSGRGTDALVAGAERSPSAALWALPAFPAYRGLAVHCPLVRHADPPDRRGGAAQSRARARRDCLRGPDRAAQILRNRALALAPASGDNKTGGSEIGAACFFVDVRLQSIT